MKTSFQSFDALQVKKKANGMLSIDVYEEMYNLAQKIDLYYELSESEMQETAPAALCVVLFFRYLPGCWRCALSEHVRAHWLWALFFSGGWEMRCRVGQPAHPSRL